MNERVNQEEYDYEYLPNRDKFTPEFQKLIDECSIKEYTVYFIETGDEKYPYEVENIKYTDIQSIINEIHHKEKDRLFVDGEFRPLWVWRTTNSIKYYL